MMMKDLIVRGTGSDYMDGPEFEELIDLTQQGPEYSHDPYRCPVSTPAGYERPHERERNNSYMSFTSLNRSFQIPKHVSMQKQLLHGSLKDNRPVTKPQKKNFDCYFVAKGIRPPAQNGTWLTSLCSQPVNEIFSKYKRRSEAKHMAHRNSSKCRHVSTPGEKALVFAWSSNTSHRDSTSVISRSTYKSEMARSQKSNNEQSLRVYGQDSDPDRLLSSPGFALMPVPSPTIQEVDNITWSSAGSVLNHKINKNMNSSASLVSENTSMTNVYEPYQREKRFPTIRRKKSLSPAKKRINSEPIKHATSLPNGMNKLEESPIEIFSVGNLFNNDPVEPKKPVPTKPKPFCSYRLPKNPPSDQAGLKGKG